MVSRCKNKMPSAAFDHRGGESLQELKPPPRKRKIRSIPGFNSGCRPNRWNYCMVSSNSDRDKPSDKTPLKLNFFICGVVFPPQVSQA